MKDRIKALRTHEHLTQAEFGSRVGYSQSFIARFEQGDTPKDCGFFLDAVAAAFSVPLAWLRDGKGESPLESEDGDIRNTGERIAGERKALRLSQAELAERAGIGRTQLSLIETGASHPSVRTTGKIANALGVKTDWLRTGRGEKRRRELTEIYDLLNRDPEARKEVISFLAMRFPEEVKKNGYVETL